MYAGSPCIQANMVSTPAKCGTDKMKLCLSETTE
jgi:hypothetical protein